MDFFDVLKTRQSIRAFRETAVEPATITRVLDAANRAPSAGNLQAYQIFVVKKSALRQLLARACGGQTAVSQAPVVLVFCAAPARSAAKYGSRGEQLYCIQDATIACAYAQLAASALGLASVWIGAVFEPETIKELLGLTEDLWPIALLPLGWAAEVPPPKSRRPLKDLVREF